MTEVAGDIKCRAVRYPCTGLSGSSVFTAARRKQLIHS